MTEPIFTSPGMLGAPPLPQADWALFLDIDGTLLDIAEAPDRVVVPPPLRDHLRHAAERLSGALALVSGRALGSVDALFDPLRLAASGQHGSEWRPAPQADIHPVAGPPLPDILQDAVARLAGLHPGILIEHKSHALAVHYRNAPELGAELGQRLSGMLAGHDGLMLMPGRHVWEVKAAGLSKGSAVELFMREPHFAGRRPVFIGDDRTDEDGFRAVEDMGGLALPVGALAQVWPGRHGFADAAAVRRWLAAFAERAA
ncbi:MAG: trehalose-phosphatase [Ferrovibrio sp.]|jgi:trehalose 6-phosphate phosphatase|uniref:trehalose-phosphatase n=1 Tax=Ferrovibrio sp. TaxID=1917215 RepID=UPI00391BC4DF